MGIRSRLRARERERRRAWSQRVLEGAVLMIEADANTDLVSAMVDDDPEFVRIVYRSRWWPRVLGYRGHVPVAGSPASSLQYVEQLSLFEVCEPLGRQADVLTVDGGIEWWGDGYPTLYLSPELAGSPRTADAATVDDDEAWARWRERRLTPLTDTGPARWLAQSTQAAHDAFPARAVLRHPDGPDNGISDLPVTVLDALCTVLARHTATPDECWFCVWDGYAWVHDTPGSFTPYLRDGETAPPPPKPALPSMIRTGPRATIEQFDYVLFSGPVTAAPRMGWYGTPGWFWREWPNLIWPTDRAWLADSGIDDDWLEISGPRALIDELDTIAGITIERRA
ncbi:hypothetical protein FCG67_18875 [Rhodococcus oryzae]|uniref:Uncharacterized protein n=1 Tax=Rhodococcus oryzae TaxID=2571143 RepID=A0ABY2RGV8_9NOCA|nr:hypothetical protein [Rhodococcus oryzae]TJZ76073.1 hypothetical protein FCG67_18875 [Rhodococcus oryzae]